MVQKKDFIRDIRESIAKASGRLQIELGHERKERKSEKDKSRERGR